MGKPSPSDEAIASLTAELLYETLPQISFIQLQEKLSTTLPSAQLTSKGTDSVFLIAHRDHVFEYQGGQRVAGQTLITVGKPISLSEFNGALDQTWDWSEARNLVAKAKHRLIVTEWMAGMFNPANRVDMFFTVLSLVSEMAKPLCIHFGHAERIVDPALIQASKDNFTKLKTGFLNVRLFRIEGEPDVMVMDTRGLAVFDLPDLQIHFQTLEPSQVAAMLYNTAVYIYENGDCIKDGHTVQGLSADHRWRCQHEESLVGPKRIVLDIDPGEPFAAGKRNSATKDARS